MASSAVDIVNLALSHFGARGRVVSIDPPEDSEEARRAAVAYQPTLDMLLRTHDWNFCRYYVSMAPLDMTVPGEWNYAYAYPLGCVFAREVFNTTDRENPLPFEVTARVDDVTGEVIGRLVLTDQESAVLRYTALVTSPGVFDPMFVTAFSYALAVELAPAITKKADMVKSVRDAYAYYLEQATVANANEGYPRAPDRQASWITGRA